MESDDGTLKGYTTPMDDLVTYEFKNLNTGKITPKELFTNTYIEELYDSEHFRITTKLLRVILDAKYEKTDLNKVMETQCQHMTITKRNELLKLIQIFEELLDGTLAWETVPADFELK